MKKLWIAVVAIAAVTIEVCILILGLAKDKTGPIITIYQEQIEYSIGCSDDVILAGVVANDKRDGNVSANAIVVSRSIIEANKLERIEISASDNSGNVTTTKLLFAIEDDNTFKVLDASAYVVDMENLQYEVNGSGVKGELAGYEIITKPNDKNEKETSTEQEPQETKPVETPQETKPAETPEETKPVETPQETKPTETPEVTTKEPQTQEPTTSEPPTVGEDGRPVIELRQTEITVAAGASEMRLINCIKEIYDDKDSRDVLFRRVGFTRNVDLSQPGEYTVGLYCTDSEGNKSQVVELKVIVE